MQELCDNDLFLVNFAVIIKKNNPYNNIILTDRVVFCYYHIIYKTLNVI